MSTAVLLLMYYAGTRVGKNILSIGMTLLQLHIILPHIVVILSSGVHINII